MGPFDHSDGRIATRHPVACAAGLAFHPTGIPVKVHEPHGVIRGQPHELPDSGYRRGPDNRTRAQSREHEHRVAFLDGVGLLGAAMIPHDLEHVQTPPGVGFGRELVDEGENGLQIARAARAHSDCGRTLKLS